MEDIRQRPADFHKKIRSWYAKHKRDLPWRKTLDPYKIWISEVMLQQTSVRTVIPYYRKWIKLFPNIEILSRASYQKVLRAWQGLGYYTRVKNIHRASKIIRDQFGGQIPPNYDLLKTLPGFGSYTTAAVLSIGFDQPYPVIEANIRRLLMRLLNIRGKMDSKHDKTFLHFLTTHLPPKKTGLFNQALMELGALVCRPRNPLCLLCPVIQFCQAFKEGSQEVIPQPKKRNYRKIEAVVGIIKEEGRYLIQKRPPAGLLADFWEFPGGKRKAGETLEEALHREIKEELGVEIKREKLLTSVHHAYTQFQVTLYAYKCHLKNKPLLSPAYHKWVTPKSLHQYPFPSGSVKIIKFLKHTERNSKKC